MTEQTTGPKYPQIEVQLTGRDGNAFAILAAVQRGLRQGGIPAEEISAVMEQMKSGDYDNLLRVAMQTVTVL